jgi:hypothetical protein
MNEQSENLLTPRGLFEIKQTNNAITRLNLPLRS